MSERIWFARSYSKIAGIYRVLHLTRWDIVAVELDKNTVYYVTPHGGVVCTNLKYFLSNTYDRSSIEINISDKDKLSNFLHKQKNKKFNWLHYLYLPSTHNYNVNRWGNANMVAYALSISLDNFTYTYDDITPTELWVDIHSIKG